MCLFSLPCLVINHHTQVIVLTMTGITDDREIPVFYIFAILKVNRIPSNRPCYPARVVARVVVQRQRE